MKKSRFLPVMALLCSLCSCTDEEAQPIRVESVPITFACSGDFDISIQSMTRGELTADGKALTDVWVLDYIGGALVQQIHQSDNTAEDFGEPTLNLSVGQHNLYFVASRGQSPTLNTEAHTLTFGKVLDTFYKSLSLDVSATSSGNQSVTLERCVTKLKMVFSDAIPEGAAMFVFTPETWYYGIDYLTGEPTTATASQSITVNIPSSAIGQTGLDASIYGFSSATEWQTDVSLNCKASDNTILGAATISDAPMKRNRVTSYTGPLFSSSGLTTLSLSSDWLTEYTATW